MKLDIKDKSTIIDMDYNFEAYQEMKKVEGASYNIEDDTWEVNNKYVKHLLKHLHDLNLDVKEHIKLVNNSIQNHVKTDFTDTKQVVKTVKLNVVKDNPKSLAIGFDYDPKILELVKSIEGRSYNSSNKSWRIGKDNIDWLYAKLDELEYIDLSDIKPYTSHNSEVELSLEDFPKISITPKDFQWHTLKLLLQHKKIVNGLEAGLGKTPITVMACEYVNKKALIVVPATLKYNWENEIYKINPDADVVVLDGKSEWEDAQYTILNYDILENFMDDIVNSDIEMVIFDEAHKLRGVSGRGFPTSKRAKLSIKISKLEQMEYVFPITATPFINQTKDIFNLLVAIDNPMSKNWYVFANTYCGAENTGFGTTYNGSSNQDRLNSRLYPHALIRLRTEDHVDLPDRMRSFLPVQISMTKYNKAVKDYMDNRDNLETSGDHLVHFGAMRRELAIAKARQSVNLIKDLLEQNKSVVIFTNYKNVVEFLYGKFENNAVMITGDINSKDRQKAVDDFQSGKKKVFIGNIEAAGEGITLTKSHHMIVTDFHWSPVVMVNQVEKRIHRMTQNQVCTIQYLYVPEAIIDQAQLEMLEEKLNDSSLIIDGKKEEFFTDQLIDRLS